MIYRLPLLLLFLFFYSILIASINAGLGERQVNTLLSGLNIPPVSHCMMSARQKDVGVALQEVAKETVDQALCEEVELTKR